MDWNDVEQAAKEMAGNWRKFQGFAWHRGHDLEDANRWAIIYTSHRDSGLLEQSNSTEIARRLAPFSEGDDPDVVFESHCHWAVGHIDGFSVRVFNADQRITRAFEELCRIKARLEDHPVLNESDYSDASTTLPWKTTATSWAGSPTSSRLAGSRRSTPGSATRATSDLIENRDDQGAWAPRDKIIEALQGLGLWPERVV